MRLQVFVIACLVGMATTLAAQQRQELTLQQCIDLALENNLSLKRQENTVKQNEWAVWQTKMAFLPTLNGSIGYNWNTGTVFNQVTFQREENQTRAFSSPSLRSSVNLFDGLGRYKTYKQSQAALEASQEGLTRQRNLILTQLLQAYLNVVVDKSNVTISERRIELLRQQEARQRQLFQAGTAVEADVLNITSQLAVEELNLLRSQNQLERDKLTLLQTVIPASQWGSTVYDFATVDTNLVSIDYRTVTLPSLAEVEATALTSQPDLRQQELLVEASKLGIGAAKADKYPTLDFSGSLQSNYSTNGGFPDPQTGEPRNRYLQQLDDNFNYSYGLSLTIPLFNNGRVKQAVENAKIQKNTAEVTFEETRNTLITNVRQAYLDLLAARQRIESLDRQLTATIRAYQNAEARFNQGLIDYYAYFEALNNQSRLEAEQVQSRYEFYFRKKVIDFYMGRDLRFDQ